MNFIVESKTFSNTSVLEIESLILECASYAYNIGAKIINLSMHLLSITQALQRHWKNLSELIDTKKQTIMALIALLDGTKDYSMNMAQKFLASFPHSASQLILPPAESDKFDYPELQLLVLEVVENINTKVIFFAKEKKAIIETLPNNLSSMLKSCKRHKGVFRIDFYFKDANIHNRNLTIEEENQLMKLLREAILEMTSLREVYINNRDIRQFKGGDELYNNYIYGRQGSFLVNLINDRREAKYNRAKIMILGDGAAGKTSLVRSLIGEEFIKTHEKTVIAASADIVDVNFCGWKKIPHSTCFARDLGCISSAVIKQPFVTKESDSILKFSQSTSEVISAVSQCETNTSTTCRPHSLIEALRRTRNPMKLSVWDFGGQKVFQAFHSLYLTTEGIYFIVFNAEKLVNDFVSELEKLKSWMVSVSLFCPEGHMFLIGTRAEADVFQEQGFGAIQFELGRLLEDFFDEEIIYNEKDDLWFFPVENSLGLANEKYLQPLRKELNKLILGEGSISRTWTTNVQLSWMCFMDQIVHSLPNPCSLDHIQNEALKFGFSFAETEEMITFFGKAGTILNFSHVLPNQKNIVLKPTWLIEVLAELILCIEEKGGNILEKMKKKSDGSRKLIPLLQRQGILSTTVLKNLLKDKNVSEQGLNFITSVCEYTLVISRLKKLPNCLNVPKSLFDRNKFWLFPSLQICSDKFRIDGGLQQVGEFQDVCFTKYIAWGQKIPIALYQHFICSFINHASSELGFKVVSINAMKFVAYFFTVKLEIIVHKANLFVLSIYGVVPKKTQDNIIFFVKQAYEELAHRFGYDICSECDFFVSNSNSIVQSVENPKNRRWDCFLSHTWGKEGDNHKRVMELGEQLKRSGLKVWIDSDQLNDTVEQQVVEGIEDSHVFIAFITKDYVSASNSPNSNAGQEFRYAASTNVSMIVPIVMEPELLNLNTWNRSVLKLKLATNLYIDFSSQKAQIQNFDRLVKRIVDTKTKLECSE